MLDVTMNYILIMDVLQTTCNLFDYPLGPILRQHFHLVDAQVVHEVATLCQFRDQVSILVLSERLD